MRVQMAFLDPIDPKLVDKVQRALPDGWSCLHSTGYDEASQLEVVRDVDVVFAVWSGVASSLMQAAPKLKLIQKLGVGAEKLDLDYCAEHAIAAARLAGVNAATVAEHTIMLMLACLRRLPSSDQRVRAGEWFKEQARGFQLELRGKTVGIVGLGAIGKAVATRLRPFGVSVLYHDVAEIDGEIEAALDVERVSLDELTERSDLITLHVPLTVQSANMFDEARLRKMKRGAFLINCARGGLVDEGALSRALREGHLAGAGIDTFADEPRVNPDLFLDGVILTPHCAGASGDNFDFVIERAFENVRTYLESNKLPDDDVVFMPATSRKEGERTRS